MLNVLTSLAFAVTLPRVSATNSHLCTLPWNLKYFLPEQVHIAIGENVSAIVVTWSTKNYTKSVVEYGINGLTLQATGSSMKFVDDGPRKFFQYIHRVTLTNLQPKSHYRYHCGSNLGWSDIFEFNTVPDDSAWSPRLLIYGDLGTENAQSLPRLQEEVAHGQYDMILHNGDFAYDIHDDNGENGDKFMRQIEPIAAYVPYMVTEGNHEWKYNFSHYKARFSMPRTKDNMLYSFDLGPAHFIAFATDLYWVDSYDGFSINLCVSQYQWLENDLKEATKPENRAKRPWIITFAHRPMYCSDDDIPKDDCFNNESRPRSGFSSGGIKCFGLEDLFYKYGVDLEIWAHEHSYERLWPVYNHKVYNGSWDQPYTNPRAPVHIITGSAGCNEGKEAFIPNQPEWSAFRSSDYGYARMQIYNATHLYLDQVSDDQDGAVIDRVWLIKDKHGPYELDIDV